MLPSDLEHTAMSVENNDETTNDGRAMQPTSIKMSTTSAEDEQQDADDEMGYMDDEGVAPEPTHSESQEDETNSLNTPLKRKFGKDGNTQRKKPQVSRQTTGQRQRKRPENIVTSRPIGRTLEECHEWDRKLIAWRDAGESWLAIRKQWEEMTGQKSGMSSLPNRYHRLKNNFSTIPEEQHSNLLEVKRRVEKRFDEKKWEIIATEMVKDCQAHHMPDTLKRQYKKLVIKAGCRGPTDEQKAAGVVDSDFDIQVSEDDF